MTDSQETLLETQETLLDEIRAKVEATPYKVYGDYRDELSKEQVALLLEDRQKFDEAWCEVEWNAGDYADWSELHKEIISEFGERIMELYPDDFAVNDELDELEWRDMPDEVVDAFHESTIVDCSDLLETCLRNSSVNFVALPVDPEAPACDEDGIGPPNGDLDDEQNDERVKYLAEKFGIDGWAAESCYYHEQLKVMGQLDLAEVYEKGKPKAIQISPDSTLIFHTSWNGSGCMGDVKATKTVSLPAKFRCDDSDRYGVQEVYGFTGSMWRDTLVVTEWEAWD